MSLAGTKAFAVLRVLLRPIGVAFPGFKKVALRAYFALRRIAMDRETSVPPSSSPEASIEFWLQKGGQAWVKHPEYPGNVAISQGVPGRGLKLADRIAESDSMLAGHHQPGKAAVEALLADNLKWALQVAAQGSTIGHLDSILAVENYSVEMFYARNLCLFAELYGADAEYPSAPADIPEALVDRFTLGGKISLEKAYRNARYPARFADILTDSDIERLDAIASGSADAVPPFVRKGYSSGGAPWDQKLLELLPSLPIAGADVGVFGSIDLFREAAFLRNRARRVTSIRVLPFANRCSRVQVLSLGECISSRNTFDLIVAVNGVDSFGLGMLGEQLDAEGDIFLMRKFESLLKPGGRLILSVPVGLDRLVFNVARIYGRIRQPMLLSGWRVERLVEWDEAMFESAIGERPVFVLTREQ